MGLEMCQIYTVTFPQISFAKCSSDITCYVHFLNDLVLGGCEKFYYFKLAGFLGTYRGGCNNGPGYDQVSHWNFAESKENLV